MSMDGDRFSSRSGISLSSNQTEIASLDVLDHQNVEWDRVQSTAFLIHQRFAYEYPAPIADLNHRLIVIPPERHLDQQRVMYRVDVSLPDADLSQREDEFGNSVLEVRVEQVERSIAFEAWVVVERRFGPDRHVEERNGHVPMLLEQSNFTQPDRALRAAAADLKASGDTGLALARRINSWVHSHLQYAHDVTSIRTTAAEALANSSGVCQDYAHVMLSLCRLCNLPARYVSGHLLGEGGTHAWVEVLLTEAMGVQVVPLDPTHNCEPGMSYVAVAIGRDYGDVAPTSGTYRAPHGGLLSTRKRVSLTSVEY